MYMGVLLWITVGLVAGSVARLVMPGPSAGGMAMAISLGIGGALLGGFLATVFGGEALVGIDYRSLLMAIGGTLIVLLIYRSYAMRSIA